MVSYAKNWYLNQHLNWNCYYNLFPFEIEEGGGCCKHLFSSLDQRS